MISIEGIGGHAELLSRWFSEKDKLYIQMGLKQMARVYEIHCRHLIEEGSVDEAIKDYLDSNRIQNGMEDFREYEKMEVIKQDVATSNMEALKSLRIELERLKAERIKGGIQ